MSNNVFKCIASDCYYVGHDRQKQPLYTYLTVIDNKTKDDLTNN